MMAQIPLPWQLTDALCALGLGFLWAGASFVLGGLWSTPARLFAHGRARRRRRASPVLFAADAVWGCAGALFVRAWALTGSHAAQVRGSIVLGAAVGYAAFWLGAAPVLYRVLRRAEKVLCTVCRPFLRLAARVHRRIYRLCLPGRERRRLRWEERAAARAQAVMPRPPSAVQPTGRCVGRKDFEKNEQKELQSRRRVYYNNLY